MNLLSLLQHLAAADAVPAPTPRRAALAQVARTAAAALPLVASAASSALAQRASTTLDALQLLVRISWLQDEFYARALNSPALVPMALRPDVALLRTQQQQHITVLETYIRNSGGTLAARPGYDFTGSRGGQQAALFPTVFTSLDAMLVVAQVLEDLAVRSYLGQLAFLATNADMLDTAARMLAVEGRHAAHLRLLRQQRGAAVKPWISGTDGGGPQPPATAAVYAGEDRQRQLVTVTKETDVSTLFPLTPVLTDAQRQAAATEAFDEPLTNTEASAILGLFTI